MTNDEQLIDLIESGKRYGDEEWSRLLTLARIGERVTRLPREIYEAANAIADFDGEA